MKKIECIFNDSMSVLDYRQILPNHYYLDFFFGDYIIRIWPQNKLEHTRIAANLKINKAIEKMLS